MTLRPWMIGILAVTAITGMSLTNGAIKCCSLQEAHAESKQSQGKVRNRVILSASSPFEDLTEYALANNAEGMKKALKAFDDQAASVRQVLPPPALQKLTSLVAEIRQAQQKGENQVVAMNSVEAYRVLVDSLDAKSLVVPLQVSLLDYAGFKLKVLLAANPPDWTAIQGTVAAAGSSWKSLAPLVRDKALSDAVNTMITGLNQSVAAKNSGMAGLAAQMDLALVDLLEGYFERTKK
jgi:hypothetical protein